MGEKGPSKRRRLDGHFFGRDAPIAWGGGEGRGRGVDTAQAARESAHGSGASAQEVVGWAAPDAGAPRLV